MTQDEIIEMARQAGLGFLLDAGFMCHQEVKDFAKLVAAKEREACAKTVEKCVWPRSAEHPYDTRSVFAEAIRARGEA